MAASHEVFEAQQRNVRVEAQRMSREAAGQRAKAEQMVIRAECALATMKVVSS